MFHSLSRYKNLINYLSSNIVPNSHNLNYFFLYHTVFDKTNRDDDLYL